LVSAGQAGAPFVSAGGNTGVMAPDDPMVTAATMFDGSATTNGPATEAGDCQFSLFFFFFFFKFI
jgi:hypothetical protein